MKPIDIIQKYYPKDSLLYKLLIKHSTDVTNKALIIANNHPELGIDKTFVEEAGTLHDIGIYKTNAKGIQCFGLFPYIAHGYLGAEILRNEGLIKHALVCERHTGAGLTLDEIETNKLPLPHRDMMPISIEEQVICFADCFYSKSHLDIEKEPKQIRNSLSKFGERSVKQFDEWSKLFL